jgi:predicted MFS family arabinose efflux permease
MGFDDDDAESLVCRNIEARPSLIAVIGVSITGILFFLGLPVITGVLAEDRGLTSAQLGAVASIAMGTTFVSSIFVTTIVARWRRRPILAGALTLLAIGHCGFVWGRAPFHALALFAILSGLGGGVCYAMCLGMLSAARHSVLVFSVLLFFQVIVTAIELAGFPWIARYGGTSAVFAVLAALSAGSLAWIPWIPEGGARENGRAPPSLGTVTVLAGGLCLAGVMFFYVSIGSLWTFLERVGVSLGLTQAFVGSALSVGNLLSLLGTLVAVALTAKLGVQRASGLSLAVLAGALAIMGVAFGVSTYLAGTAMFFLCWNLIDILQATTISGLDGAGRVTALIPAAQSLGNTLGPAVAGTALQSGASYPTIVIGTSICVLAAAAAQLCGRALFDRHQRISCSGPRT